MKERIVKEPGPDHPISIAPANKRMQVLVNGEVIADSDRALVMDEARHDPVAYFPRSDVQMDKLTRTDHQTYCPYKGDATYYSIAAGPASQENAVWSYEQPFPAMEQIREFLAFYPGKVDIRDA